MSANSGLDWRKKNVAKCLQLVKKASIRATKDSFFALAFNKNFWVLLAHHGTICKV